MAHVPRRPFIRRRYLVLAGLLLVIASNVVRSQRGERAVPGAGRQVAVLPVYEDGSFREGRVEMAYRDTAPDAPPDQPVVLLVHGSPVRMADLDRITDHLGARDVRVLAPELPGFGGSTRKVPDYSFTAHAAYLDAWLQAMSVTGAHVMAFSQGAGVAMELSRRAPERVASMILVSAVGVQEFELLGIYGLNRAVHGLQLGVISTALFVLPHFGWLDGMLLNIPYARSFYDSDLRPMRDLFHAYDQPMLLLHGREDFLVPPGTAQETHRLVPQSELLVRRGGHLMVLKHTGDVMAEALAFIGRFERGEAVTRATADPARVEKSLRPFDPVDVDKAAGVAALVMVLLIALGTFISEDLACIGAGLLAAQGVISYFTGALGAFIGIFVGDLLLFWAGAVWGKAALRRRPLRWFIKEAAIRDSAKWFARRGPVVVLLSRFVPGSRFPTFVTAGMLHTNFWLFLLFFFIAGLVWAPLLVWLAMTIGQQIIETLFAYKLYTLAVIGSAAALLWLLFRIVIPLFSFKGRRALWGRWRRLTRWEFWPTWIFYPPMVIYIFYLGVRFRSFTLFTAANPAIPLGGVVGESKRAILEGLKARRELLARYALIPAELTQREKEERVIDFMDRHGLSLPVVLKPDVGQRGLGVAVARNISAVADYFAVPRPPTLVQEYVPGFEFAVFYYRMPGQPRGHILSITEKRFPSVVGDGRQDLEHLILKDPRAVCMAPYYVRMMDERRYMVPAEDETVPLVEIGSHCRGAVFHDGRWIKTLALERSIDELSRGYEGFYFGRYDLRAPSLDDLQAGKGFKVIELNGVTAESANIYDASNGLFDAYAILARQWLIAFKIGDRNRRKGIRPAPVREVLQALADYEAAPEA